MFVSFNVQSEVQVMYFIKDCSQNNNLWLKDTTLRDNGAIKIKMCCVIPNPKDIKTFMVDDIPLVIIGNSNIVLKHHMLPPQVRIDTTITNNLTKAFCIRHMQLTVVSITPNETNCNGYFCDRQRDIEKISIVNVVGSI